MKKSNRKKINEVKRRSEATRDTRWVNRYLAAKMDPRFVTVEEMFAWLRGDDDGETQETAV